MKIKKERSKTLFPAVRFTAGPIVMQFTRQWSPIVYDPRRGTLGTKLLRSQSTFPRVAPRYLVQFGISYSDDRDLRSYAKDSEVCPMIRNRIRHDCV
jgi:hypothetical protein